MERFNKKSIVEYRYKNLPEHIRGIGERHHGGKVKMINMHYSRLKDEETEPKIILPP